MKEFIKDAAHLNIIHIPRGFEVEIPRLIREDRPPHHIQTDWIMEESIYFLMSLIFIEQLQRFDAKENWYVPLSSKTIRSYVDRGEVFLKWLEKHGILEATSYQCEAYSKAYRFKKVHRFQPYRLKHTVLVNKLARRRMTERDKLAKDPVLSKLFERSEGVILAEGAEQWVENEPLKPEQREHAFRTLEAVRSREFSRGFFMKRGENCHRAFTSYTNLKSELREFLRLEGEPVGELDITCSQFQILYLLFKDWYAQHGNEDIRESFEAEIKRYAACFRGGMDLYLFFGQELGWERDKVKSKILPWLFDPNDERASRFYPEISVLFQKHFPMLSGLVREYKATDSLALELQRIEAQAILHDIAINQVYPLAIPFITIHDSILVSRNRIDWVEEHIWNPSLKRLGFPEFTDEENENDCENIPIEIGEEFHSGIRSLVS